jgi:hypothetical protein
MQVIGCYTFDWHVPQVASAHIDSRTQNTALKKDPAPLHRTSSGCRLTHKYMHAAHNTAAKGTYMCPSCRMGLDMLMLHNVLHGMCLRLHDSLC